MLILLPMPVAADTATGELEQLMQQEVRHGERFNATVTSVGKHNQKASETAAAVFVITQDDIRRSGATQIPEVLRMVPGLNVARIDSNKWAVSARGFNSRFSNKLLVLIDGREVYNPTFGGVYWEVQDTPLFDIDRIEVIRGPGASLWGANAVNGVINIITKSAADTLGGHLSAGAGTVEKGFGTLRYGAQLADATYGRVWAKGFTRGSFDRSVGGSNRDDWNLARAGFRIDRDAQRGTQVSLLGSAYTGELDQTIRLPVLVKTKDVYFSQPVDISGFNLLGRWREALSATSELTLQAYYDHTYRHETIVTEDRDIFDLDLQHRFSLLGNHRISWGAGYRLMLDRYVFESFYLSFRPVRAARQLFSFFVQDDIDLIPNVLTLTIGSKFQHNDFSGFEGQPSVRAAWQVNEEHMLWGAVSRAVRSPARGDADGSFVTSIIHSNLFGNNLPLIADAVGSRFAAEEVLAFELGYRYKPKFDFFIDGTVFLNDYRNLRGFDFSDPRIDLHLDMTPHYHVYGALANSMKAQSYGTEWLVHWEPFDRLELDLAYAFTQTRFTSLRGPLNFSAENGQSPQQQVSLRSNFDLTDDIDFDLWLRYVDRLPLNGTVTGNSPPVPAYVTLDTRLAWRPFKDLELSLVGQNLLNDSHLEFEQELFAPPRTRVPRSFYFKLDWAF